VTAVPHREVRTATVSVSRTPEEIVFDANPLRLVFGWDGARWCHRLEAGGRRVCSSLESDPNLTDPEVIVSPAYQQEIVQETHAGPRVLLVGQSGPHHFSAVFEVARDRAAVHIGVDVAVKSPTPPRSLAATYEVDLGSGNLRDGGDTFADWSLDGSSAGFLRFESERVALASVGRGAIREQALALIDPTKPTQRLRYQWKWSAA
jgi:hypothetical protein